MSVPGYQEGCPLPPEQRTPPWGQRSHPPTDPPFEQNDTRFWKHYPSLRSVIVDRPRTRTETENVQCPVTVRTFVMERQGQCWTCHCHIDHTNSTQKAVIYSLQFVSYIRYSGSTDAYPVLSDWSHKKLFANNNARR